MARAKLDREGLVAALTRALEARLETGFGLFHDAFLLTDVCRDIDPGVPEGRDLR